MRLNTKLLTTAAIGLFAVTVSANTGSTTQNTPNHSSAGSAATSSTYESSTSATSGPSVSGPAASDTGVGTPSSGAITSDTAGTTGGQTTDTGSTGMMSGDQVKAAQAALNSELTIGIAEDGVVGRETRAALRQFQTEQGLPVTGELDTATVQALGVVGNGTMDRAPASVDDANAPSPDSATESNTNF